MADESMVDDGGINTMLQKMDLLTENDTNQNFHERLEKNEPKSMVNMYSTNHLQGERSALKTENKLEGTKLPAVNLPEKILIVIDTVKENNCTPFELGCGTKFTPLQMIKRAVEVFIRAKGTINRKHEYALMILKAKNVEIICEFTNNDKKLISALKDISESSLSDAQEYYDLSPCFSRISKLFLDVGFTNPSFVNRVILIYTRSNIVPKLTTTNHFDQLMKQNFFFFDALFIHEPPSDGDESDRVYSALGKLDTKQNSWIFEVGRNAAQLHNSMAKLLAHPLLRPKQENADYKVFPNEGTKVQTNV